jgi:hypothetical protein
VFSKKSIGDTDKQQHVRHDMLPEKNDEKERLQKEEYAFKEKALMIKKRKELESIIKEASAKSLAAKAIVNEARKEEERDSLKKAGEEYTRSLLPPMSKRKPGARAMLLMSTPIWTVFFEERSGEWT